MPSAEQHRVDVLIETAARGEAAAIDALLREFRQRLCGTVSARIDPRLRPRVDPSDIVQETLATAVQKLPDYTRRRPVPFFLWLRKMALEHLVHAQRRHLDALKRTVRREVSLDAMLSDSSCVQLSQKLAASGTSPSQSVARREDCASIQRALASLSATDRELLLMKYVEQLSNSEIASVLDTTVPAVKMRHLRSLRKLQAAFHQPAR